ncbi:hypothetical protein BZA77DRAFT_259703 [Pyronema omphalodes]|nr:hypothetical protein BZA77DRAFT_259703 [Pyronema omphalodes]
MASPSGSPSGSPSDCFKHLVYNYPMIDNHAHPILKSEHQNIYPLESICSEAHGTALRSSINTLSHIRATNQLASLLGCDNDWETVKRARNEKDYQEWNRQCFQGIQCALLDDGLDNPETTYKVQEHDQLIGNTNKRIVRIEAVAEKVFKDTVQIYQNSPDSNSFVDQVHVAWASAFKAEIKRLNVSDDVVGFKSILCYRRGLDVPATVMGDNFNFNESMEARDGIASWFLQGNRFRLDNNILNYIVVVETFKIIRDSGIKKPVQFHTGLGDNDINLLKSNPAHMQLLISKFPEVPIVLLHSSYPYTREAGYLATMYDNVYLDFGEVIPMLSKDGQKSIIREMLEITPFNKLLWSSDGHWFPETFYLGSLQTREVVHEVLEGLVQENCLSYDQASSLVKKMFFENSQRLYDLSISPAWSEDLAIPASALTPNTSRSVSPTLNAFDAIFASHKSAKFLRIQWVDYSNTLRLRVLPISQVRKALSKGPNGLDIRITQAAFSIMHDDYVTSTMTPSGMWSISPDWSSLRSYHPAATETGNPYAAVMCDIKLVTGEDMTRCPRTVLRHTIDAAAAEDISMLFGFETEVTFFERTPDGGLKTEIPNAHFWSAATALTPKRAECMEEIVTKLENAGIEVNMYHPESANGQFEFVTGPLPPVEAVDALYITRQIIFQTAERYGMRATMHPKPYPMQCGGSSHTHFSVNNKQKENAFIKGLLENMQSFSSLWMAGDVSFERLKASYWAGGLWVCWGEENRETPLRKCTGGNPHWEFRAVDGTANMYLATAALVEAGIRGVRKFYKQDGPEVELMKGINLDPGTLTEQQLADLGVTKPFPRSIEQSLDHLIKAKKQAEEEGEPLFGGMEFLEEYIIFKTDEDKRIKNMPKEEKWRWAVERY